MEKASAVMYSIANFFTWILVILSVTGIVFCALDLANIWHPDLPLLGAAGIVYYVIVLIVALITIAMVRRAKGKNTSKGWDVLFLVLGIIGGNIFYFLGGLFGLIARR